MTCPVFADLIFAITNFEFRKQAPDDISLCQDSYELLSVSVDHREASEAMHAEPVYCAGERFIGIHRHEFPGHFILNLVGYLSFPKTLYEIFNTDDSDQFASFYDGQSGYSLISQYIPHILHRILRRDREDLLFHRLYNLQLINQFLDLCQLQDAGDLTAFHIPNSLEGHARMPFRMPQTSASRSSEG